MPFIYLLLIPLFFFFFSLQLFVSQMAAVNSVVFLVVLRLPASMIGA
jgi:hypothetical protein